jgi:formylglycine-generating enzyme required for sulfatase activity
VFELTQKQYAYFKNEYYAHGDYFKPTALACNAGDEKPLQNFGVLMNMFNATARNWWEADAGALKNLKEKFSAAGTYNFDLPTEAMWYRAMRADSTTYYYDGIAETPTDFNYNDRMAVLGRFAGTGGLVDNGDGTVTTNGTVVVGQYRPNAFGLYDMLGNVMEATHDAGAKFAGSSTDPCNGVTSNGAGVFGNAWERDGEIWPQSEIVRNVHSTAKYTWIGVRLAFFEGAHPNKPVEE